MEGLHSDLDRILFSEEQIQTCVGDMGAAITRDYQGKDLVVISVLRGAAIFMADLVRQIHLSLEMDFMAVSSYGMAAKSSGVVNIQKDLSTDITGRHVLIAEDIIDSGRTLSKLRTLLIQRNPKKLKLCTLLDKPERRTADVKVDYSGFNIPDEFVVGYGLDYAQKYRNLPFIGVVEFAE